MLDTIKRLLGLQEDDPDQVEANLYAYAIVRELNRMGKCYVKETKEGRVFQEVRFRPPLKVMPDRIELEVDAPNLPYGISLAELKESKIVEGLATVCKRPVTVKHNRGSGFWYVIRRANVVKANFHYTDLRAPRDYDPQKTPLLIPIGRDDNGDQVWRDLEKIYHLLIAGATGKGKTSLIHCIICWLIQHTTPDRAKLVLVDLKEGLDLNRYNGAPHLEMPVCITPEAAYQALRWVDAEISRRGEIFRAVNAESMDSYRDRSNQFMNNVVFVFDEITNLGKLSPEQEAEAWFWLRDGAQRARALGIHFIVSTQRPSVQVIDGDIKMNFTARVGLGTATDVDSRVILDNNMATGLDIGDLVYQDGGNRGILLRGPLIATVQADQVVEAVIKHHQHEQRRVAREAALAALKREELINRMLEFAVTGLKGRFAIEPLFAEFGEEVTHEEIREIAQELEEKGVLEPAAGRRARKVVVCRLSYVEMMPDAPPDGDQNGHE